MGAKQKTIAQFIKGLELEKIALPSNIRYGSAIFGRGAVEFIEFGNDMIEAWVGGLDGTVAEGAGSRRRSQVSLGGGSFSWHCSGNPKNHQIFCKHCVALALAIQSKDQKGS